MSGEIHGLRGEQHSDRALRDYVEFESTSISVFDCGCLLLTASRLIYDLPKEVRRRLLLANQRHCKQMSECANHMGNAQPGGKQKSQVGFVRSCPRSRAGGVSEAHWPIHIG